MRARVLAKHTVGLLTPRIFFSCVSTAFLLQAWMRYDGHREQQKNAFYDSTVLVKYNSNVLFCLLIRTGTIYTVGRGQELMSRWCFGATLLRGIFSTRVEYDAAMKVDD